MQYTIIESSIFFGLKTYRVYSYVLVQVHREHLPPEISFLLLLIPANCSQWASSIQNGRCARAVSFCVRLSQSALAPPISIEWPVWWTKVMTFYCSIAWPTVSILRYSLEPMMQPQPKMATLFCWFPTISMGFLVLPVPSMALSFKTIEKIMKISQSQGGLLFGQWFVFLLHMCFLCTYIVISTPTCWMISEKKHRCSVRSCTKSIFLHQTPSSTHFAWGLVKPGFLWLAERSKCV